MFQKFLTWLSYRTPTIQTEERLQSPTEKLIAEVNALLKVENLENKIESPDAKLLMITMHTGSMANMGHISKTIFYKYDLPTMYDCIGKTGVAMCLGRYMTSNMTFYGAEKALNDMLTVLKSYDEKTKVKTLTFKEKTTLADIATLVGAMSYLVYY